MRKTFIMAALALVMSTVGVTNTWAGDEIPIPLDPIPPGGGNGGGGNNSGPGGDGNGNGGDEPGPRSITEIPTITQDGHILYIYDGCAGAELVLQDEFEEEVYSIQITDEMDEIILPSSLSGTYTILVIRGDNAFGGEIEL